MTDEVMAACDDLDETVSFFVEKLGFRLEQIYPADAPRVALLAGHGRRLRLQVGAPEAEPAAQVSAVPAFVLSRLRDARWGRGRAAMRYRDLIPGRQGGAFVASHIHVAEGGQVRDYVHYHQLAFQMIYCYRGWVRLVYEGQGPEFVLSQGECVLQPPAIRHRVLEASPGLEVVEVASPAEHITCVDHDMTLPNAARDGRHVRGIDGIERARLVHGEPLRPYVFGFVVAGHALLAEEVLHPADAFVLPPGGARALRDRSGDFELLEVALE